jgi:hypothetical protein
MLLGLSFVVQHRIAVASDHEQAAHDQLREVRAPQGGADSRDPGLAPALVAGEIRRYLKEVGEAPAATPWFDGGYNGAGVLRSVVD